LSLRDIEELLFERGIVVSYETVRRWSDKFGVAWRIGSRLSGENRAIHDISISCS